MHRERPGRDGFPLVVVENDGENEPLMSAPHKQASPKT
jgi:hypothetical protein